MGDSLRGKRNRKSILIYCIIAILASCDGLYSEPEDFGEEMQPQMEETPPPEPEEEQEQEKSLEQEPTTEDPVEEIIEEITEEVMNFVPIEEYPAYSFEDGKLYGMDGDVIESCDLMDDNDQQYTIESFMKDGNDLLFSIKYMESGDAIPDTDPVQYEAVEVMKYFKQSKGTIEEIDHFTIPESIRIEMEDSQFKIKTVEYNGMETSRVYQGSGVTAYLIIDGYYCTKEGLWFSVPESYSTRLKGLYWFPVDGNIRRVKESGRIF